MGRLIILNMIQENSLEKITSNTKKICIIVTEGLQK